TQDATYIIPGVTLVSVRAIESGDVWAVGWNSDSPSQPVAEHWNGQRWSAVNPPSLDEGGSLNSVDYLKSDSLWAVGSYFDRATNEILELIEYYDGSRWRQVDGYGPSTTDNELRSV